MSTTNNQQGNTSSHANEQGAVGTDQTIQQSKIQPLSGSLAAEKGSGGSDGTFKGDVGDTTGTRTESTQPGYKDETVDGARVEPFGKVQES